MNILSGIIDTVESTEAMSLVRILVGKDAFTAIVLDTPATAGHLQRGKAVELIFKETEVSLAKGLSGEISLRNRFPGRVREIRKGRLLSEVALDYRGTTVSSIITTASVERLNLRNGDDVEWLVKTNEIALSVPERGERP